MGQGQFRCTEICPAGCAVGRPKRLGAAPLHGNRPSRVRGRAPESIGQTVPSFTRQCGRGGSRFQGLPSQGLAWAGIRSMPPRQPFDLKVFEGGLGGTFFRKSPPNHHHHLVKERVRRVRTRPWDGRFVHVRASEHRVYGGCVPTVAVGTFPSGSRTRSATTTDVRGYKTPAIACWRLQAALLRGRLSTRATEAESLPPV